MDLTQIRYFLALAQTLNFTRAAEACNITQPALTKSIQRLEDELGGPLLLRERSLTQLTELGRTMLPLLRQTFDAAQAAKARAADFRKQETSPLRIGLDGVLPIAALGDILRELARRLKGFELTAIHGSAGRLNESLLRGEIDAAVLAGTEALAERVNRWVLCADRIAVLMPAGHRLAGRDHVPADALGLETLIATEAGGTGEGASIGDPGLLARLRGMLGGELRPRHRVATDEQVRQIVGAGLGIAVASERGASMSDLIVRPLGDPAMRQDVVLAAVAGRPLSRAADVFVRMARARAWALPEAA